MPQAQKSDYDLFDYDYDTPALRLDEAISKARDLRSKTGGDVVYRIMPTDSKGIDFRVVAVPREEVFVNFVNKFTHWVARFTANRIRRNG
jgi:hypothetical protein